MNIWRSQLLRCYMYRVIRSTYPDIVDRDKEATL